MRDHSYCCPLLLLVWGEGPYEEEEDEGEEKEGKLLLGLKEEVLVLIH